MRIAIPLLLLTTFAASACSARKDYSDADLKIDAGWHVGEGGTNDHTIPGVMFIGMCTSTAVSDNTLLFAGHCLGEALFQGDGRGKMPNRICIESGTLSKGACAESVWVPPSWDQYRDFHQDVAVAIFKRGTFKRYFEVNDEGSIKVGDKMVLVGYSQHNLDAGAKDSKRWGFNTISSFDGEDVIITQYGGNGLKVAVSPGDSGGPIFKDCKVSGVASRMDEQAYPKRGLHTNTTNRDNVAWLKSLRKEGAEFCGYADSKKEFCDESVRAQPRDVADDGQGQPAFPCSETGTPSTGPATSEIFLALDASDGLHVSAPMDTDKVFVCYDKVSAACLTEEIPMSFERATSDRRILKSGSPLAIGSNLPRRMVVVAKDKNGRNLGSLAVDLSGR